MAGEAWIPSRLYRGANRWWDDNPTTDPDAPATGSSGTVWRGGTRRATVSVTVWRDGTRRAATILGVWDGVTIRPLV